MDSKAESEYQQFLQDTIMATGQDGLFELATMDPLIYPLQTWLHALTPGSTFHSLQVKGAVMNVLFPFHSQELMALLCCYIEGVYVRTQENINGIGCLGGFNYWYHPGFWSLHDAADSLLLHLNECTKLREQGNAFRVGGLCWSPALGNGQDLIPSMPRARAALRDFTTALLAKVKSCDDGGRLPALRYPLLVSDRDDNDALAYVGHNRKPLPPNTEPLAPPAVAAAARAAAAAPPVPVPPFIPVITEHGTPVDGSTNGNGKKRTTQKEDHIDTAHKKKKNGSAGGKWRAHGFIAPSQLGK